MRVQTSFKMANLIKEVLPDYEVQQIKIDARQYVMYVDYDKSTGDLDYDYKIDKYRVIEIIYPPEYYATPSYLNTRQLNKIFKDSDKTLNGFKRELKQALEV